ncbi:rho family-interacting cell polarization regulator 2 isoform X4 [Tachysurus vachellii]|uniref:rho family-interacting cell polarization regulator 2 isoform X4 n=1 Tax=Tachysurus vachellii TaxID=175792 RepID=UPI00296B26C1|nr:rho family-interacting cell polarization regulator 2 isoform X4 [Tachysurus vachellii]
MALADITEDDFTELMHEEAEDVFIDGVSSRVPEIMAAGTHSPGGPSGIIRSQSFAGFSTLQERRSRCNSFIGNSTAQKKSLTKPKKPHLCGHKSSSSSSHEPQPKRVEEVYEALKQGLDEYLEVHQSELDKLTSLMKDMKRNSRLGVLYDLDKQIKTIERYIRRLEFHISKVDELYEGFCIQRRLRDGASKMKQAFTASPSTKGTRESLTEVNRRYKEYTENMSTFEGELENLLGEFHIKMKGLAGFARLCPGDQYEIFMRYGRQRWKLKGKIEANSRQSWDGEEMIFMPLITDLISIKVTELKGLATHVLVGSVICETKDLYTAMPQVVAVDINDLGTIKLNLEVTWFPFDVEDLTLSSSNVSKTTALQRRVSVYSQGTPETPTFQDTSFFSALPDDVFENGGCGVAECKRLSFTFSDTPVSSPAPSHSHPEITVTPPEIDQPSQPPALDDQPGEEEDGEEEEESTSVSASLASASEAESEREWERAECQHGYESTAPSLSSEGQVSAVGPEDVVFLEPGSHDESSELKPVELDGEEGSLTRQLVRRLTSSDILPEPAALSWAGESSLEEVIHSLLMKLESVVQRCRELQDLEQEVMKLEDLLKCRGPAHRSRSSSLSLTVESALESFDFLNTSDFDDEDTGDDNTAVSRSMFFDMETERIGSNRHPEARGHLSEALTEDTGVGNSVAGSPLPLSTGNDSLDMAIVIHLQYCNHLIQMLTSGGSTWQHKAYLHKLSVQTELLEELTENSTEWLGNISSAAEVLPGLAERSALLSLWCECTGSGSMFHSTLEQVLKHMQQHFTAPLQEIHPHNTDSVIRIVVTEMMDRNELTSIPSFLPQDVLTVFQFYSYVTKHNVTEMKQHLLEVATEAAFAEHLSNADAECAIKELQEMPISALQPRSHTLHVLAGLLTSDDPDLTKAASTFLSNAASHPLFRSKAVHCYTKTLSEASIHAQKAACVALSCLQAGESLRAVVALCDSDDDELHHIARQTLLTFGEEGRLAYEQLDTVPREMVRLGTRRGNAVTTAF